MSTRTTLKYERDEASGREMHLYWDVEEPGYLFLEVVGMPFTMEGPVCVDTAYPSTLQLRMKADEARRHGLPVEGIELSGPPAQLTLKLPKAWAHALGVPARSVESEARTNDR